MTTNKTPTQKITWMMTGVIIVLNVKMSFIDIPLI